MFDVIRRRQRQQQPRIEGRSRRLMPCQRLLSFPSLSLHSLTERISRRARSKRACTLACVCLCVKTSWSRRRPTFDVV